MATTLGNSTAFQVEAHLAGRLRPPVMADLHICQRQLWWASRQLHASADQHVVRTDPGSSTSGDARVKAGAVTTCPRHWAAGPSSA